MNPPLSPQQKRVKEAYQVAFWPTMIVCSVIWVVLGILVSVVFRALGGNGSINLGGTAILMFFAAHLWTVRKLKRQGLSLASQKTEVVENLSSDASCEAKEWHYPKTWLGSVGNASIPLLISGMGWLLWQWPFSAASALQRGLGLLAMVLFGWCAVVGLIFIRSPHVRIDERGITAFPSPFWRRRVRWADVASCEMRLVTNYLGQGPSRFYNFKTPRGKMLLHLIPGSFSGLSLGEQAEIEREIRRRMGHETPP